MAEYQERDYDLAILIILVIFCWPAAIIYYFTRPMITKYKVTPPTYAPTAPAYGGPVKYCPQCGRPMPETALFCPTCGKQQTQAATA